MASAASRVPPEIWLVILAHLAALPRHPRERSPLLATAVTSRALCEPSQQLLFERVRIRGRRRMEVWARTGARRWTVALFVADVNRASGSGKGHGSASGDGGLGWVAEGLRRGLDGKGMEGGGRGLERLQVVSLSDRRLSDSFFEVEGLRGLRSLKLGQPWPADPSRSLLPHLQHLAFFGSGGFRPGPLPPLPSLTHLTLASSLAALDPVAAAYPRLTLLTLAYRPGGFSLAPSDARPPAALPPALTHLAVTSAALSRAACAHLPDRLVHLAVSGAPRASLAAISSRWLSAESAPAGGGGERGLQRLTRFELGREDGEPGVRAHVEAVRAAGCVVDCVWQHQWTVAAWRGW